ncbi:LUD domain-containing protein [Thermogemmatispora carboxidivorans]|uniref:LUD domain-containing protein n=1 Tax=Thermogemmatispora carboxidivorans TaxID=1382306 RepID=UPI00069B8747|nr:LUD domain-containing protein [Thermogemmatispora carboxidivorans]
MSHKEQSAHVQLLAAQRSATEPASAVHDVHAMPPFAERLQRGLSDEHMHRALERFAPSWRQSRQALFEAAETEYGSDYSFANLRQRLRSAKDEAIAHQEELVTRFKERATAAGAVVYEARSAEDANRYIYELCRHKGITLVVKSKTMVSEEIELNHYLEERGIKAVETDLGEWVAQLDHERPSHMVMPIIHKTRQQVGEILSRATGREISRENVAEQVAVIRREHRQAFLTAGMGISGANALIAESGTVMLNTNEGNGRMVTSLPPVHVVLASYDKLLPTFADAITQIRLLARSATGQPMTSYTTFITGPDRPGKEVHIILLDNGRSAMRADPRFREALRCIRCAACANICPPYQQVGGHAFGYIYSGAIGLVVTPFHHGLEAGAGPQSLCVSCNACETVCPVEIPLPSLILDVRSRVVANKGLPWLKRLIFGTLARPRLFGLLTRLAALGQWPATLGTPYVRYRYLRLFERLPGIGPLARLTRWRSLPAFALRPLRDRVGSRANLAGARQERRRPEELTVCYFAGCMTDRLYPEMGEAVIQILERCGLRVVFPRAQHCCGLPALNSGDRQHGAAMAKQTVRMLERALDESGADYIVCASTSCVVTLIQDYLRLFEDLQLQSWLNRTRALAGRIMDFTSFLLRVLVAQQRLPALRRPASGTAPVVTYHDSCQSCNCLGLRTEARQIIRDVLGLELREMTDSDVCCGFGGSTSIEHPEIAERLLTRKLRHAEETGATLLVSDNPGCLMHLRGGVDANGLPLRVLHLAQLVAEYLP